MSLPRETARVHGRLLRVLEGVNGIDPDLSGACLIGACVLFERLAQQGLNPTLVHGTGFRGVDGQHYWVEVDGWTLDPTYSQFHTKLDWLAVQELEHPEPFEKTVWDARVPMDWEAFEHPETYWRQFFTSGTWRKSYVYQRRGVDGYRTAPIVGA